MSAICENMEPQEADILPDAVVVPEDDVVQPNGEARAVGNSKLPDSEIPPKKRKTRRGKSKRKHPYNNKSPRKSNKMIKPEAPHNSNQFLLEDHGCIEDLDDNLKRTNHVSTSSFPRTRDSSFSVDSDGEFYSSPDDEEQFLIKDFVDQYESVQAERLNSMTKAELIQEYHLLENKVELLTKRLEQTENEQECDVENSKPELQREIERLKIENERLRREVDLLLNRNKTIVVSDSEDSETDSSDSCSSASSSSSSSSGASKPSSPLSENDYAHTNGHTSPTSTTVEPV